MIADVVIVFGCPRSGTTYTAKVVSAMRSAFTSKLPEQRMLHPCQTRKGLIDLTKWFRRNRLVLVRTVRDPMEVCESFEALRTSADINEPVMSEYTDEDVLWWVRNESAYFNHQFQWLHDYAPPHHRLVQIRYERLRTMQGRVNFAYDVTDGLEDPEDDYARIMEAFARYEDTPVRHGRMSAGLGEVLTPERRAWFREQLADVIEREGYA